MSEVYTFLVDSTVVSPRPFQGHREMRLTGRWQKVSKPVETGTFVVDTSQPLGLLAVYMLEPQSDDGLVTWNFFDRHLAPGALYPVFRDTPPTP